jgi:phosphoglycerate dehydrogenase-like enzyme
VNRRNNAGAKRPKPEETKLVLCVPGRFTLWRAPRRMSARLRARWPEMRVVHLEAPAGLEREIADADIFVGFRLTPEQFRIARRLKWIQATAASVSQLMFPELRQSAVVVTNASGVHASTMAEHVLGMMIALARRFPSAFRYQNERRWAQQEIWDEPPHLRELAGGTLVLVGFGQIGREVARRARAFGMRIMAVRRLARSDRQLARSPSRMAAGLAERILSVRQLHRVLPEADYVVVAAPATPETYHLIGAKELGKMKRTAYLVNVARGSLVDEAALARALRRRRIAGAALDVTEREPLEPTSPLWRLDNVFLTPHLSAASEALWERMTNLVLGNLERWFRGRPLVNRVDLERGY